MIPERIYGPDRCDNKAINYPYAEKLGARICALSQLKSDVSDFGRPVV